MKQIGFCFCGYQENGEVYLTDSIFKIPVLCVHIYKTMNGIRLECYLYYTNKAIWQALPFLFKESTREPQTFIVYNRNT